ERLVDHARSTRRADVGLKQLAAFVNRDAQRREVTGAHRIDPGASVAITRRSEPFDFEGVVRAAALTQTKARVGARLHASSQAPRCDEIVDDLRSCGIRASAPQIDTQEHESLTGEAKIHALQVVDGSHEQTGAYEQRERQRQLRADKKTTGAEMSAR